MQNQSLFSEHRGEAQEVAALRPGSLGMPAVEAESWVRRFAEAWSVPSPQALSALVGTDAEHCYPGMTVAANREGVHSYFVGVLQLFPDLRLQVLAWAATGNIVFIEWAAQATVNGRPLCWQGADVFRIAGAHTTQGRAYYDTAPIQQALGVAAAAPGHS